MPNNALAPDAKGRAIKGNLLIAGCLFFALKALKSPRSRQDFKSTAIQ